MSKLNPSFPGVACILWIAGWTYWFSGELDQRREPTVGLDSSFSIAHNEFSVTSAEVFYFNPSESFPSIPESNQPVFQSLAIYLAKNQSVTLTLTGTYNREEQNLSEFQNLGLARAEALKNILVEKGAPKENILTKSLAANNFFQSHGKMIGGVYFLFAEKTAATTPTEPSVAENSAFRHVFFYDINEYGLKKKNLPYLDSLRNYLRSEPSKKVVITGYSEQDEEESTSLKLAEMRAKAVRRYLVDNGVRRKQITAKARPGTAKNDKERVVTLSLE